MHSSISCINSSYPILLLFKILLRNNKRGKKTAEKNEISDFKFSNELNFLFLIIEVLTEN